MDFNKDNLPKTKDDWNALKEQDINLWADLTQENTDRAIREKRELETKFKETESKVSNLSAEIEKYKKAPQGGGIQVPIITPEKPYSRENLPKSDKEWNDLLIRDPLLGSDLRIYANTVQQKEQQSFWETRAKAQRTLQEEHPDMFEAELDESNQPKLDDKGKVILKQDKDGGYILNLKSEKGKIFDELYNRNPSLYTNMADAPEVLQSAMERQLRLKGNQVVTEAKNERERLISEGQVIADGVTPPQSVKVTFHNEEEKTHAQRMVNRGLYKSLSEYVINRDKKSEGLYDDNRMPQFGKK